MVVNSLRPPINIRDYPNLATATITEYSLIGKWKMPYLDKFEAVDKDFKMFDAYTVVYFSGIEGSGMRGSWGYV